MKFYGLLYDTTRFSGVESQLRPTTNSRERAKDTTRFSGVEFHFQPSLRTKGAEVETPLR